jgi:uncharacterized protein (TIGR03437 family)
MQNALDTIGVGIRGCTDPKSCKAGSFTSRIARLALYAFLGVSTPLSAALSSSVQLNSSLNPSTLGQAVTFTATVLPVTATGSVTFYSGVLVLGSAKILRGQAVLTTILLPPGVSFIKARYLGDASDVASVSSTVSQRVAAVAENGFQPAASFATGIDPVAVAVGDFNGDGKADLAIANGSSGSNSVSVLLGNGDGTFRTPVNYAADMAPLAIAVGDFNGDGWSDLVVINQSSNDISLLLGNGDGTFQPAINYNTRNGPSAVAVGDFNGDGWADLAMTTTSGVTVFTGNGDGTFNSAGSYLIAGIPNALAIGDFNGDGRADLTIATSLGVNIMLGAGNGSFQTPVAYQTGPGQTVVVGDFNGDGRPDLAVGTYGSSYMVSVLIGKGDGTFQAGVNYNLPGIPYSMGVTDFNGDGKLDLAVTNFAVNQSAGGNVSVLFGNGDGTFQASMAYPAGNQPYAMAVGDFNGDGRADLVVTQLYGSNVSVLLGTSFAQPPVPVVANGGVTNSASFAQDANGDGAPVAPGGLVSIFGTFPGATLQAATTVPLPTTAGGVTVTFNGISAPLVLVAPDGAYPIINAQLPFDVLPPGQTSGMATVVVTVNGVPSPSKLLTVVPVAPGIFTVPPNGIGNAIMVFADPKDKVVKIAAPAAAAASIGYPTGPISRGQAAFFYATGLGAMTPPVPNGGGGLEIPGEVHLANAMPTVLVGGITAEVDYAGQAPGYPGVNQINIVIPPGAPSGSAVPLQIRSPDGSVISNTALIAIQ